MAAKLSQYLTLAYPSKPSYANPATVQTGGKNYGSGFLGEDQAIQAAALNALIKDISRPPNK